ncbi:MAG: hypothetical protein AAF999_07150 [Pseudomonadota bacterium]
MQTVHKGYRGLSLLMDLNWDRALYIGTITLALGAGAVLAGMLG